MYYNASLPLTQQFTSRFRSIAPSSKKYGWYPRIRIQRYEKKMDSLIYVTTCETTTDIKVMSNY